MMPASVITRYPLAMIVIAQLFGTSLWFSVNGVGLALQEAVGLGESDLGMLTIAVQAGFISGTLLIATTGLADRVRASHLFALSAVLGALINAAFIGVAENVTLAAVARFATGLCLAGIYPLGMKLVVSWTPRHAGAALGWLVGMLTLGIASPHLLRGLTLHLPWQWPLLLASLLALLAAALILRLGVGPHLPTKATGGRPWAGLAAFKQRAFRQASLGYFGHCWELYAFWALVPFLVARELGRLDAAAGLQPWLSFLVIALGLPGCVWAGKWSRQAGSARVAFTALLISGALCLVYPLLGDASPWLLLILLGVWGVSVIADSAQFSALASACAPPERLGAALSMMNAIGFGLTIPSIALVTTLWASHSLMVIWWLLPGPVLGLLAMRELNRRPARA
ncbi:putative MFS family arabinose efflux permease [Vreelandella songnenensis]|uniref:Putative MFS family arabinose efflux permease n=1 Tax=Vreelandella songnenensis TaxID=1176243 RepID=A0A2T0UYM8_9GAMM|nr:MFS transporter [Halomonas songnenensis]PRY63040.1 putative MFS family arabinose efflux permease [Halomonas songnenensis]